MDQYPVSWPNIVESGRSLLGRLASQTDVIFDEKIAHNHSFSTNNNSIGLSVYQNSLVEKTGGSNRGYIPLSKNVKILEQ